MSIIVGTFLQSILISLLTRKAAKDLDNPNYAGYSTLAWMFTLYYLFKLRDFIMVDTPSKRDTVQIMFLLDFLVIVLYMVIFPNLTKNEFKTKVNQND